MDWLQLSASLAAALAWPVLVGLVVWIFRPQIRDILAKPFRIRLPGGVDIKVGRGMRRIRYVLSTQPRGISLDRISVEVELYDAILRLGTARAESVVRVPVEIQNRILAFWREPQSLSTRPGRKDEVHDLALAILGLLPPDLRDGALASQRQG